MKAVKIIIFLSFCLLWFSSDVMSRCAVESNSTAYTIMPGSQNDDNVNAANYFSFDFAEFDFEESNKHNSGFSCEKIIPFVNAKIVYPSFINSLTSDFRPYGNPKSNLHSLQSYLQVFLI